MFDNLSTRLEGIVKKIRGKGRLTEADVDEVMKEIRTALLEADVNVTVVRSLCNRIREAAIGATRSSALDPAQQVVKAVNDELTRALGGETLAITYASKPPTVVLMAGLQGSGKTTNAAKLARVVQGAGPPTAARRCRPPAPGRRRTAPHARSPDRRPRLLRPDRSRAGVRRRSRGGQAPRPRRRHRRHRRPAVDRHRDDGAGPPDLGRRRARLHVPRHRRDDRSGRGPDRRGVPPDAADRRRDHVEDGRRRPRWRRAVGQGGHRASDRLRLDR